MGAKTEVVVRDMINIVDDPDTLLMDAAAEVLVADVSDLENVTVYAIQATDAGTATIGIAGSPDGTAWAPQGADLTDASFAAGANAAVARTFSDANGMPLAVKQVRMLASALAGGGVYKGKVVGFRRTGF